MSYKMIYLRKKQSDLFVNIEKNIYLCGIKIKRT